MTPNKIDAPLATSTPAKSSTPAPAHQARADPTSGKETPNEIASPKPNGSTAQSPSPQVQGDKQKREKKFNKKDRFAREKDGDEKTDDGSVAEPKADTGAVASGKATPVTEGDSVRSNAMSPIGGVESPGVRTPTSRRPQRHPWTLFMRFACVADEQEIRDFFGDTKAGVSMSYSFIRLTDNILMCLYHSDHSCAFKPALREACALRVCRVWR
jgi:hypothetical protein